MPATPPARRRHHRLVLLAACLLVLTASVPAQAPLPSAAPVPAEPTDPLGRGTPFGAVSGFSAAVRRQDFTVAAQFLETRGQRRDDVETLASELSDLIDRYYVRSLGTLSQAPSGALADGLPANRERITLSMGGSEVDLFLTRVTAPEVGAIWVFASDTLARVGALRRGEPATYVERVMPASLVQRTFFGISLAQWILWAGSIVVPLAAFWSVALLVAAIGRWRIADPVRLALFHSWWKGVRWLAVVGLALFAHLAFMPSLGFSLNFRIAYARFGLLVATIIGGVLVWRLVTITFHQARLVATRKGRAQTRSLIVLGERVVKVLVVLVVGLALLSLGGMDLTTALAGVGIFGVALALGAQKSVENLLGGIFLLTDKVIAVGDYCRLSDREGWVEDITLRSVWLRTLDQTLLSVPAGLLSQGSIENYAARTKILAQSVLRLRYGTTTAQLREALAGIERLLATHPHVEQETARIRLTAYGAQAIELELFAYVTTSDFRAFLEIRQGILLEVATIVEASGSGFAGPTQFVYMDGAAPGERGGHGFSGSNAPTRGVAIDA